MTHIAPTQWRSANSRLLLGLALSPADIGKRIQEAREKRLWTQMQFAQEASVSMSSVSRWENGKLPPVRELIRIADVLGVEPEFFVEPPTPMDPEGDTERLGRLESQTAEVLSEVRSLKATGVELLERIPTARKAPTRGA